MSVTDALDALRSELPGCALVAYADLKSKLVLSTSSAAHRGQEELDRLSSAAQLVLDGQVAEGAATVWAEAQAEAPADVAMLLSATDARVFLRAHGDAPEVLICFCAPDSDLARVVVEGRAALKRIEEAAS